MRERGSQDSEHQNQKRKCDVVSRSKSDAGSRAKECMQSVKAAEGKETVLY